jgi:hypothetical protein
MDNKQDDSVIHRIAEQYTCCICGEDKCDTAPITATRFDKVIWKMCFGCYNAGILWAARQAFKKTKVK